MIEDDLGRYGRFGEAGEVREFGEIGEIIGDDFHDQDWGDFQDWDSQPSPQIPTEISEFQTEIPFQ